MVSGISLPVTGQSFGFTYNNGAVGNYGELLTATLPTSGSTTYTWLNKAGGGGQLKFFGSLATNSITQKVVSYQELQDGIPTPRTETWGYQFGILPGLPTTTITPPGLTRDQRRVNARQGFDRSMEPGRRFKATGFCT